MEPPKPRVNTFMKTKEADLLDPISMVFIVSQNLFGLNKMAVLYSMKPKLIALSFLYSVTLNIVVFYFKYYVLPPYDFLFEVVVSLKLFQHLVNCFLNLFLQKQLRRYYEWIRKFDTEIGITPKITRKQTLILVQPVVFAIFLIVLFLHYGYEMFVYLPSYLPYHMETHFYGHLIGLLCRRLRLINDYIEAPIYVNLDTVLPNVVKKPQKPFKGVRIDMNNLMDYYQTLVSAFEVLTDAIQWQFIAIVTTSFFFLLAQSLKLAINIISKDKQEINLPLLPLMTIPVIELLSLLAPCMCCDMLRAQVRRLRELVASKLYDHKLDKSARSNARALLALTETSNLSFSLLRVIDISITLPFTFVGLLITYLIILLQFHKVIYFEM